MAEPKTRPTDASVDEYLASRASPQQLADCKVLMSVFSRVTGSAPRMWGPSIVGYGSYTYTYASGRRGDWCITGFAVRGRELVVYLVAPGPDQEPLLQRLGPHKIGKSCLYLKRLSDVDLGVLEQLIVDSVAELRRRYPSDHG